MHYTLASVYEMIGYCENCFLSRLYWKIALDTSKIVNRVGRSKRCNWCLVPCCVLSLSEDRFMIEIYISLANYVLHLWGALIYFSSHMSSHEAIMWLRICNYQGCQ
jgi:hypothetical protein